MGDYDLTNTGDFKKDIKNTDVEVDIHVNEDAIDYLQELTKKPPRSLGDTIKGVIGDYFSGAASYPRDMLIAFYHFCAILGVFGGKQQELAIKRSKLIYDVIMYFFSSGDTKIGNVTIKPLNEIDEDSLNNKGNLYSGDKKIFGGGDYTDQNGNKQWLFGYNQSELAWRVMAIYFRDIFSASRFAGRVTSSALVTTLEVYALRRLGLQNAGGLLGTLLNAAIGRWKNLLEKLAIGMAILTVNVTITSCGAVVNHLINIEKKAGGIDNIKFISILDLMDAWLTGGSNKAISKETWDMVLNDALIGDRHIFKYDENDLKFLDKMFYAHKLFFGGN